MMKRGMTQKPLSDQPCIICSTAGCWVRSGMVCWRNRRPTSRMPKPITNSLMDLALSPFISSSGAAKAKTMRGKVYSAAPTLMPSRIIQEVMVVPILAPMITAMAPAKVRRPELTKPTTMTVVAVEDWTAAVTAAPVTMPWNRLPVIRLIILRILPPAAFCSPSLISFMP